MSGFDPRDVIGIHASAVFNDRGALIFLGPSGTGKTTMCNLLAHRMNILTEDAIYLAPLLGGWQVVFGEAHVHRGKRFMSEEEVLLLPHAPLRAIFRLHQAWEPILERLDPLTTCRYLTDAFFEIFRQRDDIFDIKAHAFTSLARVARSFPGYLFHFDLSARMLDVFNREMELWVT